MFVSPTRKAIVAVTAASTLLLTACGTSKSSQSAGSAGGSSTPTTQTSGGGGVPTTVTAQLAKYASAGGPINVPFPPIPGVSSLRGKTIYYVPIFTIPPTVTTVTDRLQVAASKVGLKVVVCNGNANPADITSCFNQAISAGAAGIITDGYPPEYAPQAFAKVVADKVPTVAMNISEKVPAQYTSMVTTFDRSEPLQSAITSRQIIADSKGKAHVLLIAVNDSTAATNVVREGIEPTFKTDCPGCTLAKLEINGSQFGNIPQLVAAGLVQHPKTDYVFVLYDALIQGAQQGINLQQKAKSVKLVSDNGTLGALQSIDKGSLFADTGSDLNYQSWASLDMLLRQILGKDPQPEQHSALLPIRTFTKATSTGLSITKTDSESGAWFGEPSVYEKAFLKLWGAS